MRIHTDDRRSVWLEIFHEALPQGQLNVTRVWPGAILAWHRHEHQDDRMVVIQGTLKVGVWEPGQSAACIWTVLTETDPKELVIPRGLWHGYQNIGSEPAIVLTWINQPYDPEDEHRLDPGPDQWEWRVTRRTEQTVPSWTRKNR